MWWDKRHRCSFCRRTSILYQLNMRYQLLFTSMYPCKRTNKQHRTDLLQIAGLLESPATCSYMQPDITWVECASWLSFIPLWLVAYYIFRRTFHFALSSFSPFPQQRVMAPQTPQPSLIESEWSQTTGTLLNAHRAEEQQQCRQQLVHHDSAIAASGNNPQDTHFKMVRHTGRSYNRKQHTIGCEYLHIDVERSQIMIWYTAEVRRELGAQFIAAHNGKPPWSTKAFVRTVRDIEHQDVVSSGIFVNKFRDNGPREWTKQALKTLEEAMELYMVEES